MSFAALIRKALVVRKTHGVAGLACTVWRKLRPNKSDDFDRRYGVETTGIEPLWSLRITSANVEHGVRYQATSENALRDALASLEEDFAKWTFVDLGCGKGRALIIAAEFGFHSIIGLEFSPILGDIARRNAQKLNILVDIRVQDAVEFFPPTSYVVVFLYNPFDASVLSKVLDNLGSTKPLYVIYEQPDHASLLDSRPFLRQLNSVHGVRIWHTC